MQKSLRFLLVACCLVPASTAECGAHGQSCGVAALLQRERSESAQVLVTETPYTLNKTDTKCKHQNNDRLFRAEGLDLNGCYEKCRDTADCNYFSIDLTGQYAGVCMGCTIGLTDPHNNFDFYTMSGGGAAATSTTTTTAAPSGLGYMFNKTNTKCAHQNNDRLFREENLDLNGCYEKCKDTADCNYFSIDLTGQYAGVCMGCTLGITDPHNNFNFYTMLGGNGGGAAATSTTTTVVSSDTSYTLNQTDTKCAYQHPDRLFRIENSNTHDCFMKCTDTPNCNYFSIAMEGQYTGVCMGCVEGVTQPHQHFKFYTMPVVEPPPDLVDHCEDMAYEQRVDCGWWGVTPEACLEKGCCWQVDPVPNPNHIPYCYRHHTVLPACEMSNSLKTDCGFHGIGADECESRGCCYRQSPNPNPDHVPWCYHPAE